MKTSLDHLQPGQTACICALAMPEGLRQRLLSLGLVEGAAVSCLRVSPTGSPVLYTARGMLIALRRRDSRGILVELAP